MIDSNVSVVCKNCGNRAPASSFVMHPEYKTVICPQCIKQLRSKKAAGMAKNSQGQQTVQHGQKGQEPGKPPGWDHEDEYLEKRYQQKQKEPKKTFERISADKIRCKCENCNYPFIYNTVTKHPGSCPYCDQKIILPPGI